MEKRDIEGLPNLINAEGINLETVAEAKRQEYLGKYANKPAPERPSEQRLRLETIGIKLFGSLGYKPSILDYREKKEKTDSEILKEAQNILKNTVDEPLSNFNKASLEQYSTSRFWNDEPFSSIDLKIEMEKSKSEFNIKNMELALEAFLVGNQKFSTQKSIEVINEFLEGSHAGSRIQEEESGFRIVYESFSVEVAGATIKTISNCIDMYGISSVEDRPLLFSMLNTALKYYPDTLEQNVKTNIDTLMIEKGINLPFGVLKNCSFLNEFVLRGEQQEVYKSLISKKIQNCFEERDFSLLSPKAHKGFIAEQINEGWKKYFEKFGISDQKLMSSWRGYDFLENTYVMEGLEKARPGSVKVLYEDFGIKEFQRYPIEVLTEQYDQKDATGEYGVILYTNEDHNNAFDIDGEIISTVFEQTSKQGVMVRISEFASRYELIKNLAKFDRRYGGNNKISYLILGAHGSEDGFSVSGYSEVTKDDFDGQGVERVKNFFTKKPEIVFASCSTGAENGIGQMISQKYDAVVHAPATPTFLKSIDLSFDEDGSPKFQVKYGSDKTLRNYSSGQKI